MTAMNVDEIFTFCVGFALLTAGGCSAGADASVLPSADFFPPATAAAAAAAAPVVVSPGGFNEMTLLPSTSLNVQHFSIAARKHTGSRDITGLSDDNAASIVVRPRACPGPLSAA